RVLDRKRGQDRGAPGPKPGIDPLELVEEDPERPAVADDMGDGQEQDVLLRPDPKEQDSPQRTAPEVEGTRRLLRNDLDDLPLPRLCVGEFVEASLLEVDSRGRSDPLARVALRLDEGR